MSLERLHLYTLFLSRASATYKLVGILAQLAWIASYITVAKLVRLKSRVAQTGETLYTTKYLYNISLTL